MTAPRGPRQAPGSVPATACLDWSGRDGTSHWGGGTPRPCRSCGQPALLVDADGQPQHKTCAENEASAARADTTTPRMAQAEMEAST